MVDERGRPWSVALMIAAAGAAVVVGGLVGSWFVVALVLVVKAFGPT